MTQDALTRQDALQKLNNADWYVLGLLTADNLDWSERVALTTARRTLKNAYDKVWASRECENCGAPEGERHDTVCPIGGDL